MISVLGLDLTKAVSLGIAFAALLNSPKTTPESQRIIWIDSMLMASCTRELALQLKLAESSAALAYTGALLSNIGLLALASTHPARVDRCIELAIIKDQGGDTKAQDRDLKSAPEPDERLTLDRALREEFGFDHRLIAKELAVVWGLPEQLTPLVALSAESENPDASELASVGLQSRAMIDRLHYGAEPWPSVAVENHTAELAASMQRLDKKFGRFVAESESAAAAIVSAS